MTATPEPAPRSAIGLLLSPVFGAFFTARLLTAMGNMLHALVAAIAAFDVTGSAVVVGLVSVMQFAPQLLLGPLAGTWADGGNIKTQMLLGRALSTTGAGLLAVWFFWNPELGVTAQTIAILVSSALAGLGIVVGGPAMQAAVPSLVSRRELPNAMALNTAPMTLGRVVGPAVGALTTAGFGYAPAFLMAGICHLIFMALIALIHFPTAEPVAGDEHHTMVDALRFVRGNKTVLLTLIAISALGFGSEPAITLAPPLAHELGGSTIAVGALTTSVGIGALIGVVISTAVANRLPQGVVASAGMILMAVSFGVCAFPLPQWAASLAFAFSGLGFIVAVSAVSILMQLELPANLRGRVMALWLMGFLGSRPVAAMITGAISDTWGVHIGFGCVAVALIGVAVICRPGQLAPGRPPATA